MPVSARYSRWLVPQGAQRTERYFPPILQAAIFQERVEGGIKPVAEAGDQRRMLQGSSKLEPRHLASMDADLYDSVRTASRRPYHIGRCTAEVVRRALTAPLYEYAAQAGPWGDPCDVRYKYVGLWNGYLRLIPLIRQYQREYLLLEE